MAQRSYADIDARSGTRSRKRSKRARFVIAARSTIDRKASRGSAHRQQSVFAFTVAARGEPYYEARRTSEMRLLQATYFAFAFGVPIVHLACLLVLWAAPLTPRAQRRLFVGCEV